VGKRLRIVNNFFVQSTRMQVILYEKQMGVKNRVLICPLDWGIGHATRSVPVIRTLLATHHEVIIGAGGRCLAFLQREFPTLTSFEFPGTRISYPTGKGFTWHFLLRMPRLLNGIFREHLELQRIVKAYDINLIISDNRFGCWHSVIPSVFITHQLRIRLPRRIGFLTGALQQLNYWFISHYKECWIPDFEQHAILAGTLSHPRKLPRNAFYIGSLSRFQREEIPDNTFQLPVYDLIVLLSGPEPQRSVFEEKIMAQLLQTGLTAVVVRGLPESDEMQTVNEHIHLYAHLDTPHLQKLIQQSFLVVCRSGYSSIMDLVTLGKRAILIPTPGQTEQEYLSAWLMQKKIFFSQDQDVFNLLYALEMVRNYPGIVLENDYLFLRERIINISPASTNGMLSH
jgi:uncharacterized protein (TIGR00661 family)